MQTKALYGRTTISVILILQFIPLLLLPPSSFSPTGQEWWLPALLLLLAIIAVVQLLFKNTRSNGPWDLIGFSQGFNIISRLLLLMPHATINNNGVQVFNTLYVVLTITSILLSTFVLWYISKPETRNGMMTD